MKSLYSLLSLNLHPNSNERLHLGLLMNDGAQVKFAFSPARLEVASKLLDTDDYRVLRNVAQALKSDLNPPSDGMSDVLKAEEWSENALVYLSKYSTNLLRFSTPEAIGLECNEDNFKRLFEKYIAAFPAPVKRKKDFEYRASRFIKTNLTNRTNVNLKLNSDKLKGLLFPFTIGSIGINEIPFACEPLDFIKRHDAVDHKIGHLLNLSKAFEANEYDEYKLFAIANEPPKSREVNHKIWSNLRASKFIDLVPENEAERIVEYAEEHDVRPWISTYNG